MTVYKGFQVWSGTLTYLGVPISLSSTIGDTIKGSLDAFGTLTGTETANGSFTLSSPKTAPQTTLFNFSGAVTLKSGTVLTVPGIRDLLGSSFLPVTTVTVTAGAITIDVTATPSPFVLPGFSGSIAMHEVLGAQPPVTITLQAGQNMPAGWDPAGDNIIDLSRATTRQTIANLSGNDTITVGSAGANITVLSGVDTITIPSTVTGSTTVTGVAGIHTVSAGGGSNTLFAGSGTDVFTLTGGKNVVVTGTGRTTLDISGGASTVMATQGTSTITDNNSPLLLGITGGSHQVTLTGGAPVVLATGGSSTLTGSAAAPQIGLFGGTEQIILGSAGGLVLNLGGTTTIKGGAGTVAVDLASGRSQLTTGSGATQIFLEGGTNTLVAQSNSGGVIVAGYTPLRLEIDVPRQINGNNFTSASQVPILHQGGNTLIEIGPAANPAAQLILIAGNATLGSSAITLI